MIVLFNKPFNVLSQFTDNSVHSNERKTLSDYIEVPNVYAAGRLDRDSEGLLILTDNGRLQAKLSNPKHKISKTYMVQVEGIPNDSDLQALRCGVSLKDGITKPAQVKLIEPPMLWDRDPPVRYRKSVPDSWLELTIHEGRNRQVRRMTAAIGHPTLRLVRSHVGEFSLGDLGLGEFRVFTSQPKVMSEKQRKPRR